ncbi:MAG: phage holin family protein [Bacteroidota bacterium]|jgi:putative membrane protein
MNRLAVFLARLVTMTLAVIITDWMLSGISVSGVPAAIIISLVLSILNLIVKPLLIFLTLPITVFTFGIFLFFINALIVLIAAWMVPGFQVDSFWWALAFSIILSLTSSVLETLGSKGSTARKHY